MKLHKILKILAGILGLIGVVFLAMIISEGDEAIKSAAMDGDTSIVDPLAYVAYAIMLIAVVSVVIFVLINLFTNTSTLKNTLISVGVFAAVLVVAYLLTGGDGNSYFYNGVPSTPGESHLVGAGLMAFYLLIGAAAIIMLLSGVKKLTNK
ncbi:hypothetical protein BZARG_1177 [Bizionia argentinensis JUB59]|uniref:Uncharacterized protein n=1 Tax=Bizionia argentinensis JUB59 TaxID=1046627 RepID=G2ECQ9_9FLAO|nr:hypothetical protein [Bizionia argentinensis]EGV43747.1 hypothetical protein BZARG_1177 [Bizionia argentinensis JUB59]